jgi:putative peptidoglycan lipid II flippase
VTDTLLQPTPAAVRVGQIARSTLIVMLAFGAAKALSLAQTFIIANVFGVGREWDAYVTANRIPEQIFNLIAGGALGTAFLPIFTGLLTTSTRERAWRLASHVINSVFAVTFMLSVISFVAAPFIVETLVAPGFDAAQVAETAALMRILLVSTLIFSISGVVMGILQSHQHFALPALAPILYDVGLLVGVALLFPRFGVVGIALGAVFGAALHLGIQVPGLVRVRAQWRPALGWDDPMLRRVVVLMLPRILDIGLFSLSAILITNIASRYEGAISALDWGWRLMQIPQTLIGTAMGTVIFPTLAALSAAGDVDGKRTAMSGALRFILAATLPAAVGLVLVGGPIVSLLERGAFDAASTVLVTSALTAFAFGIVTHSLVEVLARSFFADKDTWTPLAIALVGAFVNVGSALVFTGAAFGSTGADAAAATPRIVAGLALANTVGITVEAVLLALVLRRRWVGIEERALTRTIGKTLLACAAMTAAILATAAAWNSLIGPGGLFVTVARIGVEVGIGAVVFAAVGALLRMEEIAAAWRLITSRSRTP